MEKIKKSCPECEKLEAEIRDKQRRGMRLSAAAYQDVLDDHKKNYHEHGDYWRYVPWVAIVPCIDLGRLN